MYNKQAMVEIELDNNRLKNGNGSPETFAAHAMEIRQIVEKYQAEIKVVKTLSNGIKLYRAVDKDGKIITEYHDV